MARITADFGGVNVGGSIFPVGSFRAKIEEAEAVTASTGSPMIKVRFVSIHPGITASQYCNYVLLHQSLFNLKRLLIASGEWTEDDLTGVVDIDTADLVGLQVGIVVQPDVNRKTGGVTTSIDRAIPIDEATGPANVEATPQAGVAEAATDLGKLF